jgi:hypothetical protein
VEDAIGDQHRRRRKVRRIPLSLRVEVILDDQVTYDDVAR